MSRRSFILMTLFFSAIGAVGISSAAQDAAESKKFYEKVVEAQPKNANAHFDLANVYLMEKRYDEALKHYEKAGTLGLAALRMDSYYFNMAVCYAGLGSIKDAIESLGKCLKVNPKHANAASLLDLYKNKSP